MTITPAPAAPAAPAEFPREPAEATASARPSAAARARAAVPVSSSYRPRATVDVRQTLSPLSRGGRNPAMLWDDTGVWLALRAPTGTATLRLEQNSASIEATAWGDGAELALDSVPQLLGERDDWRELDVSGHDLLRRSRRRNAGLRLLSTGRVVESLIAAVIEQKVTSLEAWRAWRQLVSRHGDSAPGPAPAWLRVPPSAETWARIPSWEWHRAGVDPRRSRTVVAVASRSTALERTGMLPPDAASDLLVTLPGVGPWTAAETVQRSSGAPDALSIGDYHLSAVVGEALIGKRVDDDGMLELLEPWRGHRQRVVRLILASGFRASRFGPRMTIQDHRDH